MGAKRNKPELPKRLFKVAEAAHFLGFSPSQIRRWQNEGKLPFKRLGPDSSSGPVRFEREVLDNFVNNNFIEVAAQAAKGESL